MKFLVIAPWGNPTTWRLAKYVVESRHPVLRDIESIYKDSYSSTKALVEQLKRAGDVKVLLFGIDTVVQPREGVDVRREAESFYREWAKTLDIEGDVVSLPGIGLFHGWRFLGTPMHMFNKALYHILKAAKEFDPSFIVVDLTHGVNYLTVSVLYASVATSILLDMENRLLLYNSEPYPTERRSPVQSSKTEQRDDEKREPPQLRVLDVSELQMVIRLIRQLSTLKTLSPSKVELPKDVPPELCQRFEKVIASYLLLASGAAALIFPGARFRGVELPLYKPGAGHGEPPELREDVVRVEEGKVDYGKADASYPLAVALYYLERALDDLSAGDLVDFLNKAAAHYERVGVYLINRILSSTAEELGNMINAARRLARCGLIQQRDDEIRLSQNEAVALYESSHEILKGGEARECIDKNKWQELLTKAQVFLSEEKGRKLSARILRNLLAHGGYTHIAVEEVVIRDKKIVEVTYNGQILSQLVNLLNPPRCPR